MSSPRTPSQHHAARLRAERLQEKLTASDAAVPALPDLDKPLDLAGPNGSRAVVAKLDRNEYSLRDLDNPYRMRYGRAEEIRSDMAHFLTFGTLPPPSGNPW